MPARFLSTALLFIAFLVGCGHAAVHLPLYRRGGRLSRHEPANLSHFATLLAEAEAQYALSYREVEGNRLVRRWRPHEGKDENDPSLIDVAGWQNRWSVQYLLRLRLGRADSEGAGILNYTLAIRHRNSRSISTC
jgi:hypothetical protein